MQEVKLIGHLGHDPEIHTTKKGEVFVFSMATKEEWIDQKTGEIKSHTEWHRCEAWGYVAQKCIAYKMKRGTPVKVQGRIRTYKYSRNGEPKSFTKIVCDFVVVPTYENE